MKCTTYAVLTVAVICCLSFTQQAAAQNSLTYSTVDYDDQTNTLHGYPYTYPDYSASVYYSSTGVGGSILDASGNTIVNASQQAYGRSELFLEGTANGNPPYRIATGHYLAMSY